MPNETLSWNTSFSKTSGKGAVSWHDKNQVVAEIKRLLTQQPKKHQSHSNINMYILKRNQGIAAELRASSAWGLNKLACVKWKDTISNQST